LRFLLVIVASSLLALFTYLRLERLGVRAWPAIVARSMAWAAIGLLVLNVSCPRRPGAERPVVLLDASLSMGQDPAHWLRARRLADSLGEVRWVGVGAATPDTMPDRGDSRLAPAIAAASALGRPVTVVTDGEVEDAAEIPPDVRRGLRVVVVPREPREDWALVEVTGPARVTVGDTLPLDIAIRHVGGRSGDSVMVEVAGPGDRILVRRQVRMTGDVATATLRAPTRSLAAGEHMLSVRLAHMRDAEPRTDERAFHLAVAATPGVVLVTSPADWDARFLFKVLADVSALPVRGFVQFGTEWRTMGTVLPVSDEAVRRAMRGADLLVLKGRAVERAGEVRTRALWLWPGSEGRAEPGDWYLVPTPTSPLAPTLAAVPVDSFPPAVQLTPVQPPPTGWVALMAQAGRRGAPRPAMMGVEVGRRRTVTTAVDGLWRWAFRGGAPEQGYRALMAATVSWLLAAPDTVQGAAVPVRHVVRNGQPVTFAWRGAGPARTLGVSWSRSDSLQADSLAFDGMGRAQARLPVGTWRYRLEDGATGLVAVEGYSDELLPRPVSLASQEGATVRDHARSAARDWWWLFLLAVTALCTEWVVRRRMGLR